MKKLLNEIDELLTHLENFTHGKDGDWITETRYKIQKALRQPIVSGSLPSKKCPHLSGKFVGSIYNGVTKITTCKKCGDIIKG